jgi:flagella basal body P-ring formation protein FlgA
MTMHAFTILTFTLALLGPAGAAATDPVRDAIAAAVAARVTGSQGIDVEIVSGRAQAPGPFTATPAPGARLGRPARFVLPPVSGAPFTVVAEVRVIAGHAIAARPLSRGESLTPGDGEWRESAIEGPLLEPLPAMDEVRGARTRRNVAEGEVLTASVVARPPAVRAGDEIAIVVRSGAIEVRGVARAVSSGGIGDVIRVTTPGSREIRQARITAPATVEMVR